uniref:IQ motif containing C n=1 Tax=Gasterosteus aculeatus aculeatus TaxID=481459 RepID=A0AAQ4RBE2_GASAC
MDRREWEKLLTCFQLLAFTLPKTTLETCCVSLVQRCCVRQLSAHRQASARGFLVRNQVRRGREDFEDIVKEIDGGLAHLVWKEMVIPIPHFTDTDRPFLRPSNSAGKFSNPRLAPCAGPPPSSPPATPSPLPPSPAPLSEERGGRRVEAERDDSQTRPGQAFVPRRCIQSSSVTVGGGSQKDGAEVEKDGGDSITVQSRLQLDRSQKAPRLLCLAKEVPCTPEGLRLHRNTLTMELVWLQQAIDSRKKYLSLKDRLSVTTEAT